MRTALNAKNWTQKLLTLALLTLAPHLQALQIEVRPLDLQASAEVMGVRLNVDGQRAIIMTGELATEAAHTAGYALNSAAEMLVITGSEVDSLIENSAKGVECAGRDLIIITKEFTEASLSLIRDAVKSGTSVLVFAANLTVDLGEKIVKGLARALDLPVVIVKDTGVFFYETGRTVLSNLVNFMGDLADLFDL